MRDLLKMLLLLQGILHNSWIPITSAWSLSFVPTSTRVRVSPRTDHPRLSFVVGSNNNVNKRVGVAVAYQVGDSYPNNEADESYAGCADIGAEDVDDMHSNTFGDVLLEDSEVNDVDDEDNDSQGVFQLDFNSQQASRNTNTEDDENDQCLEYAFPGDYVEEDDEDAAQTIFPFLDHWHVLSETDAEGIITHISIAGIVSNHPRYPCGHAIVTSNLELQGLDDYLDVEEEEDVLSRYCSPESIVTTVTGSQYLLGTNPLVLQLDDWVLTDEDQIKGSVTVVPKLAHDNQEAEQVVARLGKLLVQGQEITTSRILTPDPSSSLQESITVTTASGSHYRLGAPKTFPLLDKWKRLEGGSIAGIVSNHKDIPDGELITTSPLVELDESHDGLVLVTTESGSQYQLGEAEPTKEELWQRQAAAMEADVAVMETGSRSHVIHEEEDEEEEMELHIPTIHMPRPPPTNALLNEFLAAALPDLEAQISDGFRNGTESGLVEEHAWNQTVWNHS